MPVLPEKEIETLLSTMDGWSIKKGELTKTFTLETFPFAIEFVRRIGELAEQAEHHPDIDIRFNKVKIYLSTHDEKGITSKDFLLARQIDTLLTEMTSV